MTRHAPALLLSLLVIGPALGQAPIGFRTDGTGRYLAADPPTEWGPDKNVVWKIPLTQSNAIPVILGDRLFTCAEPCVLLCVNKADGKILWRGESFYKEIIPTEAEKKQIEIERQQSEALKRQQTELSKERSQVRKQEKDGSLSKEEAKKRYRTLQARDEKLREQRKALTTLNRYTEPGKGIGGFHPTGGYTSPTPVTDGKYVYVLFGNGLAACYDLAGKRRWLKLIEHPTAAYGHGASPVLVKDRLLVHLDQLVALDTRDGREVWRTKLPPNHGTPAHVRLGEDDAVFTPTGVLVRVRDGAILARGLGSCGPNSPLVQGGKVFWVHGQARCYDLPATSDVPTKWPLCWKSNVKGSGYWFPSPVLHDGLIYALGGNGILTALEADTGKTVYEERLEFGSGHCYPSLALAGKYLFASSDNGTTFVIEPGRTFKEVARNRLETFRSTPVFEGRRMYLRTVKHLWCIGR